MATSIKNPFKKSAPAPLIDQLVSKQAVLDSKTLAKQDEAQSFAQMAAEAKNDSKVAAQQASAVDAAVNILAKANVTL